MENKKITIELTVEEARQSFGALLYAKGYCLTCETYQQGIKNMIEVLSLALEEDR